MAVAGAVVLVAGLPALGSAALRPSRAAPSDPVAISSDAAPGPAPLRFGPYVPAAGRPEGGSGALPRAGTYVADPGSANWSGWVSGAPSGASWKSVSGSWTVPHLSSAVKNAVVAQWAATGGYRDGEYGNLLSQAGTVEETNASGAESAQAFWELVGGNCSSNGGYASPIVRVPVAAGQLVKATVAHIGFGLVLFTFANLTTGVSVDFTETYNLSCTWNDGFADWIWERPTIGTPTTYAVLPDYATNTAHTTTATTSTGVSYDVSALSGDYIYMYEGSVVLAITGDKDGANAPDLWQAPGDGNP